MPRRYGDSAFSLSRSPRIQNLFKIGPAGVIGRLKGVGCVGVDRVVGLDMRAEFWAQVIQTVHQFHAAAVIQQVAR